MECPYSHIKLAVVNSRHQASRNQTWRRRRCPQCHRVYTTHEALLLSDQVLVDAEPFSRERLFLSIYQACRHRPTAINDASGLADTVIGRLQNQLSETGFSASLIQKTTEQILRRFDSAAAVQYHAFHKPRRSR